MSVFFNLLLVLEKNYLEQMVGNRFDVFCIYKINPFFLKLCTLNIFSVLIYVKKIKCLVFIVKISDFLNKFVTFDGGFPEILLCNELINYEGVYRTAPAKPGLLNTTSDKVFI